MTLARGGSNRPYGPRCCWVWTPDCTTDLEAMARDDSVGYGRLMLLVERSEDDVGFEDPRQDLVKYPLRAPKGFKDAPKMGELRVEGSRLKKKFAFPYRVHRLYFGLPKGEASVVVGVGAGTKVTNDTTGDAKQRRQIEKCMRRLRWFFGERGYQCEDL